MGNVSSINHARFARVHELTNSYNKATLLDKLIFWWQISEYSLSDGKIWFTRSIDQIAADSKISRRSVERYLQEFEISGYIEKQNKLFMKKRLYIQITDKLLMLLGYTQNQLQSRGGDIEDESKEKIIPNESLILEQDGVTDSAKLAVSIYKEKDCNYLVNNTVSHTLFVNNSKYPQYKIEKVIGDRLSDKEKNYIKGTIYNLQTIHGIQLSSPEQIFAEIVFSVLNKEQLFGVNGFNHRVQIIGNLLRDKRWSTPKGFYNHSDYGALFKTPVFKNDNKPNTCVTSSTSSDNIHILKNDIKKLKDALNLICNEIHTETRGLQFSMQNCSHRNDSLIDSTRFKIDKLRLEEGRLKDELDMLRTKLANLPFNELKNRSNAQFDRYNSLCDQQKILRVNVEKAKQDMDYTLSEMPDDAIFIQTKRQEYQTLIRKMQDVDDEIFSIGEELYSSKVA